MKSDDIRLIEKTLAGDNEAFGELVLRYQDRLCGTLVHMLGSFHDARDVAQEAFLSAFEKLGTFRKEASFYSWLFRIAYNAAVTNRRKLKRRAGSLDASYEQTGNEPADNDPTLEPSHNLQTEEKIQQVQTALNQLAPDYRDSLILKEMEGMRYDEIAAVLGCPIGTVRSRIHRARLELREILERMTEKEPETT
ncbi:ECF RNA polymerase sigma-E factor [Thalassoglobus polymorphus]|uniref:ECF RNA polymerase sigma-E factor n=1 Tax=Thalassoglobus polymorphus TaxID=2527994 RepID=A0A517QQ87_9PLAN|nr:ECF RNA polymerase sigma-E factor [Thalassoglobus polymorphus]